MPSLTDGRDSDAFALTKIKCRILPSGIAKISASADAKPISGRVTVALLMISWVMFAPVSIETPKIALQRMT
ncbi:hypothetical protein EMGBS4_16170 [Acidimicrobiaceae bacterium]|nr:hypothetical protein EMGBS4_16170 [Acidimicrobiaceae bacterium]